MTMENGQFVRAAKQSGKELENLKKRGRGASAAIIEIGRGASDARFGFMV